MKTVRTRFAPSPTGHMHIGGLRTALYNFLFARRHGGKFLVRIEDTDRARLVSGAQEEILDILKAVGLTYDEGPDAGGKYGPYVQSERMELYRKYAEELAASGHVYWCVCTPERLEKMREEQQQKKIPQKYDGVCRDKGYGNDGAVLRLRVPENRRIAFSDLIRGDISFASAEVDDQVLLKSDGFPTYHLANVVDDHLMKITHVIRGEEWLSSTPKHVLLYEAFSWKPPEFAHLPLILNEGGGKLSKRAGHAAAIDYINDGYLPEALLNFLALLGWNPRADEEVYSLDELVSAFDISKVNKSGAVFSLDKLNWIAGEHMKRAEQARLAERAEPFVKKKNLLYPNRAWLEKIMKVERERIHALSQVGVETDFAFTDELTYDAVLLVGKKSSAAEARGRLQKMRAFLDAMPEKDFDAAVLEERTLAWIKKNDLGNAETLWPLRVALTGREKSPGPFDAAELLGKERTLVRVDNAISSLAG